MRNQLGSIAAKLGRQFPGVEAMLKDAPRHLCFRRLSPGPLEEDLVHESPRTGHKEIKRRTNLVGIFPKRGRRGVPGRLGWRSR